MRIQRAVPLGSLAFLVLACVLIRDYGIRQRIEVKAAVTLQGQARFCELLERMHRMSLWPGSDLTPFETMAEVELRNLLQLERGMRTLHAELWFWRAGCERAVSTK